MKRCSPELRRPLVRTFVLLLVTAFLVVTGCQPPVPRVAASQGVNSSSDEPASEAVLEQAPTPTAGSDVIVVGAGISGLAAALELGRGGANVTVIDMSSVFGGHAVMSQGSLSIAGSPVQRAAGVADSPDLAYDDILKFGDDPDPQWVRYYVDNSRREVYDWVTELGVRFEGVVSSPGNSVDREHQPAGRGIGLVTPIYRGCLEQKTVRFVWNSRVEQLLTENGRVTGVIARNLRTDDEEKFFAGAVVLATGGFQSNLDMVREFWPAEFRFPERILIGSGRNSVGFGHKLAEAAGGELVNMDHQWNYFTGIPDPRYPGTKRGLSAANMYGIIVNAQGRRFANLHGWAKAVMPPLLQQPQATLWFVFDEATKPFFVVSGSDWADFKKVEQLIINNPALVQSAGTLEELAQKAGLPPENLVETVKRYNQLVERGVDEDFHRFGPDRPAFSNSASPALATPPYYAMQAFPLTRKSMGGVAIDRQCRVVDKQKQAIPGLYAVGELTGLALINGKAALEGTFLGPCIVTGRVAARSVLAELKREPPPGASETNRCASCHDVAADLANPRPGYWHFENVHRVVLERGTDCRQCHAELAVYRAANHRINPQSLTAACFQCHTARE
ncbi:MAG: FAD-dependent oxidoreductase [Planctomycetaceae bacterium]|nr:FAD-dependent oxidoreductase [Planctomycetaceae bacterium]